MAQLYSNENFPQPVVEHLRGLGHDVLTSHDAGKSEQKTPDDEVLSFATAAGRAVLTHNRRDFVGLHKKNSAHAGIIACTEDVDFEALANRIHDRIKDIDDFQGKLIRVYRPMS
jgi:predicted nuclease of predicted toxin-antitoxin system